ncbi:MAG: hypothetical protein NTU44_13025 [Bacteroidetes bacterium]|nr:hypothetical protein [Bacteroidota bacterium]
MAAKLVFSMANSFSQGYGSKVGICTAASYAWAKACLKKRGGVKSFSEIGIDAPTLNIQMATLRRFDADGKEQTEMAGLSMVCELKVTSLDEVISKAKQHAPHVAIFWNATHTMGYRYAHNEKEFFDIETGLFRAKTSAEILAKMKEIFSKGYSNVQGMRILSLKS